jgi:hypothetical protein
MFPCNCGWHRPHLLMGQDGRVVKGGALGGTHDYVAWDRTWSNPNHIKPTGEGLRFLVTVAGIYHI